MSFDMSKIEGSPEDLEKTKKYPALWPEFKRLMAKREAIMKASQPLEDKRKPIIEKIAGLNAQDQELVRKIEEVQQPLYAEEIDAQLSAMSALFAGARLSDGDGTK